MTSDWSERPASQLRLAVEIARFEFVERIRTPSTWFYFGLLLLAATTWMAAASGAIPGASISFGSGRVAINSSYAIASSINLLAVFATSILAAVMGRSIQRDFEVRFEPLIFTTRVGKPAYVLGRFGGSFAIVLLLLAALAIGVWCATMLPNVDPARLGPQRFANYIRPYFVLVLPNAFFIGVVFFALAARSRTMRPVYVAAILLVICWLLAIALLTNIGNHVIAALIDPFGDVALDQSVRYWTAADRNTKAFPTTALIAGNRLLWGTVAVAIASISYRRFALTADAALAPAPRRGRHRDARVAAESTSVEPRLRVPSSARALWALTMSSLRDIVFSPYFAALLVAGLFFVVVSTELVSDVIEASTYPVTYQVVQVVGNSFRLFMVLIIGFYAGELTWREREARIDQIIDALPIRTWVFYGSKLLALVATAGLISLLLIAVGMTIQAAHGYFRFEPALYVHDLLGVRLVDFAIFAALALAIHSVVRDKYAGHVLFIVCYAVVTFGGALGIDDYLLRYGTYAEPAYSELNGFGDHLVRTRWFQAYWVSCAAVLTAIGFAASSRGYAPAIRDRVRQGIARFGRPTLAFAVTAAMLAVAFGAVIFHNTHVLNVFESKVDRQARKADYERRFKRFTAMPTPTLTDAKLKVAIYPRERSLRGEGTYALVNRTGRPIDRILVTWPMRSTFRVERLEFDRGAKVVDGSARAGAVELALDHPLEPGASASLGFAGSDAVRGFENSGSTPVVIENGTFLFGDTLFPRLGYQPFVELRSDAERKRFGLPPQQGLKPPTDASTVRNTAVSNYSDWITYEVEVVTDTDQTSVAPGHVERSWVEGERTHTLYRSLTPSLNFFAFESARLSQRTDRWTADDGSGATVPITILHAPHHAFNVDRIIGSTKDSLRWMTGAFGPYPFDKVVVAEFPRTGVFAQSDGGTIFLSEALGFIARVDDDDPKQVDYPYFVTAHEIAHAWWGHQLVGANAKGSSLLSEGLAEYSALMIARRRFGEAKINAFLAFERDRYLQGRGLEQKIEPPLVAGSDQPYVVFRKAGLVLYAMADAIGVDRFNAVLRAFLDDYRYRGPPYPTSLDLVGRLRAALPEADRGLVRDLLETVVLYDNRAVAARSRRIANGRYQSTFEIAVHKTRVETDGRETDLPVDDAVEVALLAADGKTLHARRHRITREQSSIVIETDDEPARAVVDPRHLLIDRVIDDNVVKVCRSDSGC